jgi:hypothetical protein
MVSHDHKFVFVKINKTAGTSMNLSLQESIKGVEVLGTPSYEFTENQNWTDTGHNTIQEIDPNSNLKDYFKFTFVRNPWDRLVSVYHYSRLWLPQPHNRDGKFHGVRALNEANEAADWRELYFKHWVGCYVCIGAPSRFTGQQADWITDRNGNIDMDFIGKFENLQNDFDTVCEKISIPSKKLPHLKKTEHKHYSEYYDDKTVELVARKYRKDIKIFGYKFENYQA